ncbi:PadR family transcriptional regulator [Solimonas sp. K1W22B-7]|uniref:PadR family transcriptional regulator n=1 Tax=Solimonas sp. K1W22B-7 TaxID=2303331 RepID=UPI000E335305|nr:PadR family transcriptional regulator [Solimonas sp. K1W22B-7]AXQ27934.1 PadR family transcriptional regulator [Solimonas sp. K1W22B-7]
MRHHHENHFERLMQHFGGRHHHGGRGFGRFGGSFADDGEAGGRGMRMGRKLASGDLQLLVLSLLAEKPRHGYEIIKALEERSKGFYTPSPGMIYPALTYLEEIGHATVVAEGTRKLYHVTEAGQAHLSENQAVVEAMFQQFERVGEKMEKVRRAFSGEGGREADFEGFGRGRGSKAMFEALGQFKAALIETRKSSAEEQQRVMEILKRATAEIRNKP